MSLKVYGASDDLIEVEGDIREEFTASTDASIISVSDGTLLSIFYSDAGVWHIDTLWVGSHLSRIEPAGDSNSDNYSDVALFEGNIDWVAMGEAWAKPVDPA